MARFLLVVPPLTGHINPMRAIAGELTARGHEVAWAGHAPQLREVLGVSAPGDGASPGSPRDEPLIHHCAIPADVRRAPGLIGPAAFKFLWEEFFAPLAESMAPGVEAAVRDFAPDVLLTDQHAIAGALVAERHGVVHLTSSTTSAELIDPLASMPKVAAWLDGILAALRARFGDPAAEHDPRFSPHGVLAFTSREFLGEDIPLPHDRVHLLGPALATRAERDGEGVAGAAGFPWEALDAERTKVLVTLGTANTDASYRFLTEALTALDQLDCRGRPVQGIVVDPGGVLSSADVELPPGVLVRPYVPQLELLEQLDAVVCHGGHNTVCESLWHGVPLVVAPIRDDQPIVAGLLTGAGAGVRVRFNRVDATRLAKAINTVLDPEGGHREAALRVGRSFRAAGGVGAAADHLERAASRPTTRDATRALD